jgi:hypothetical protein
MGTRMSEADYEALLVSREQSKPAGQEEKPAQIKAKARQNIGPSGMNKTEARYVDEKLWPNIQAEEIKRYRFEKVKRSLSIEGAACWYTPDFEVINKDNGIEYHEIKGAYITEDALIKFKTAMATYPEYDWLLWQWTAEDGWKLKIDSRKQDRIEHSGHMR